MWLQFILQGHKVEWVARLKKGGYDSKWVDKAQSGKAKKMKFKGNTYFETILANGDGAVAHLVPTPLKPISKFCKSFFSGNRGAQTNFRWFY